MHIEVFEGSREWHWRFRNGSRTTSAAEGSPTKAGATANAKAVVRAAQTVKQKVYFDRAVYNEKRDCYVVRWY